MSNEENFQDAFIDVNFDEIPDINEVIPVGTYTVEIIDVETGLQTKNLDPKWRLTFKIIAGKFAGETIKDSISFGPKARQRVASLIRAIGIDGSKGLLAGALMNKRLDVRVSEIREWTFNGKTGKSPVLGWDAFASATHQISESVSKALDLGRPPSAEDSDVPF